MSTPAEPIITYAADGKPFAVFCSVCNASSWLVSTFGGSVGALDAAVDVARHCCAPRPCPKCQQPIAPHSLCRPCSDAVYADRERAAFEKAKKVPLAEFDGTYLSDGDELYVEAGDWKDAEPLVAADGTRFLWGTHSASPRVDFERELEDWLQEHHEDASDSVDHAKLRAAEALANEALARVVTYYADEKIAVLLPAAEDEEEDEEPAANSPADLGWNAQSVARGDR